MSAVVHQHDRSDHPMLRALTFLGRPCRIYRKGDVRPYLEGTIDSLGVNTRGEFLLLVRPAAVQIDDELTPGGCAMIVGTDEDKMRHVYRMPTDGDFPVYNDCERPVHVVIS